MRALAASFPHWLPGVLGGFQELLDVLHLASGFVLVPVEVPGADVARVLSDWLARRGVPVTLFEPQTDADWADLAASILRSAPPPEGGAAMVIGRLSGDSVGPGVIAGLRLINQRRDTISRHLGRPLLWSGQASFLDATWNHAPDFWSVRAVDQRIAPPEGGSALDPLRRLLAAAREQGDLRNEARLSVQLADDLTAAGAAAEASTLVRETLERARGEAVAVRVDLVIRDARLRLLLGDTRAAIDEMNALLAETPPDGSLGEIWLVIAGAHARAGRPDDARTAYEKALSFAASARDANAEVHALVGIGLNSVDADGSILQARQSIEAAITKARSIGDASLESHALRALAQINSGLHDDAGAKKALEDAFQRDGAQTANDEGVRLALALADARAKRSTLLAAGEATGELDAEVVRLRRKLREGGQLRAGDSLGEDRFLLLRRIGRGGFATVWEALDRRRRERVAVKVLHSQLGGDTVRRERFFRGARVMAELNDESIVRVIEPFGEDGGFCFFVMELVEGGSFEEAILEHTLSRGRALEIVLIIARALSRVHRRGIVHRDIKPSNILLDASGAPKLGDFDLVADPGTTGGTRTGAMGSFLYSAPEVLSRPQDAGARADVFGLGMTAVFGLYQDRLPILALRDTDKLLRSIDCDDSVRTVLRKAVAWEPEERYPDAGVFALALQGALSSQSGPVFAESATSIPSQRSTSPNPTPDRPASSPRHSWSAEWRTRAALVALALTLTGALALLSVVAIRTLHLTEIDLPDGPDSTLTSLSSETLDLSTGTSMGDSAGSTNSSSVLSIGCPLDSLPLSPLEPNRCIDLAPVTVAGYRLCMLSSQCPEITVCPTGLSRGPSAGCVDWAAADAYCRWEGKSLPRLADLRQLPGKTRSGLLEWTSEVRGTSQGRTVALLSSREPRDARDPPPSPERDTTTRSPDIVFRCVTTRQ